MRRKSKKIASFLPFIIFIVVFLLWGLHAFGADTVVVFDDLENMSWSQTYWSRDSSNFTIVTSPTHSGTHAARLQVANGSATAFFGDHPLDSPPGNPITDITIEMHLYPEPGFQWANPNMKIYIINSFRAYSSQCSVYGYPCNRAEGLDKPQPHSPYYFTVGIKPPPSGGGRAPYGELTRMDGISGGGVDGELWGQYSQNVGTPVQINAGEWTKLTVRLKLNTAIAPYNNGIFQLWINDVLKCDYHNMNFRGSYTDYGWNDLILTPYVSASTGGSGFLVYDDITIKSGAGSLVKTPLFPTNLVVQ